jgi:hypothetical protein
MLLPTRPFHLESISPTRKPHWRFDRAVALISSRPRRLLPTRADDHAIRVYRSLVFELIAAGDDVERKDEVIRTYPDVYAAHLFNYSHDFAPRQEIEARLLARQSYEEIGKRHAATPKAIEYYTQLFFDIQDRLANTTWTAKVIRDRLRDEQAWGCSEVQANHGYALRLSGFSGGPVALDAMINPVAEPTSPQGEKDPLAWLDKAYWNSLRTKAAETALTIEVTRSNALQLMKLAIKNGAPTVSPEERAKEDEYNMRFIAVFESIRSAGKRTYTECYEELKAKYKRPNGPK